MKALSCAAALAFSGPGCFIWYGDLPVGQCVSDADCEALEASDGEALACHSTQRICVPAANDVETAVPEACHGPNAADANECASSECAAPLSTECRCLDGAWTDPTALVIGTIAPQTFATHSARTLRIPYVPRWEKNVTLALEEWREELPSGALQRSGRPLAVLHCNSNNDPFLARRAFSHLTQVGAPIVITLTDSDTEAIVPQTVRTGTPVICSSCYAAPSPELEENRLIWQVGSALVHQAPLAASRVDDLTATATARGEPSLVLTFSQEYAGIDALAAEIDRLLATRGRLQARVQTPRAARVDHFTVADSVIEMRPSVIVVAMDSDFTTYYLGLIEAGWPEGVARPFYVLSSMNQELALLSDIIGGDEDLRRRISGTGFWPGPDANLNLKGLNERFYARHAERIDQTQFGYDAFYAAAYAVAWADPRTTLDAAGVALGLEHLQQGDAVNVGPFAIRMGLAQLNSGRDIDLMGTSNALDWNPLTHATQSDVTLWCITRSADQGLSMLPSAGPVWHHETGEITGDYACP